MRFGRPSALGSKRLHVRKLLASMRYVLCRSPPIHRGVTFNREARLAACYNPRHQGGRLISMPLIKSHPGKLLKHAQIQAASVEPGILQLAECSSQLLCGSHAVAL